MARNFQTRKNTIITLLVLLMGADVALGVYAWKLGDAQSAQHDLAVLTRNRDLLKKDIQRAEEIRRRIPDIQKECAAYEESLLPDSTVYSTVGSELYALAEKSGLRLDNRSFKRSPIKGHDNLTELNIEADVTGDYRGVVRFLNGIQRSSNFYAIQGLSARAADRVKGAAKDALRVSIHIKTYVRAA